MGKLVCPICDTPTSFSPLLLEGKGILLERSGEKYLARERVNLPALVDENYMMVKDMCYAILICQSCDEWFVAGKERRAREWTAVYPIQHKAVSKEIPEPIKGEFEEASLCFAVGAYRACAAMCEIALEAIWREQGASGLQALKGKGTISPQLHKRATEVRLWGNVAKHEPIPDAVSKEDAEQLLTYLEIILNDVYVEAKRLDALAQKRKQLKKSGKAEEDTL